MIEPEAKAVSTGWTKLTEDLIVAPLLLQIVRQTVRGSPAGHDGEKVGGRKTTETIRTESGLEVRILAGEILGAEEPTLLL
jgi:hypothetical protein